MRIGSVCLIGGSGFLGARVAHRLAARGVDVRIPTRNRERAKDRLILLPTAEVLAGDVHDPRFLRRAVHGADAVINLVGVLHDGRGDGFRRNHQELPAKLVSACRDAGVGRLVHVSALGAAADAPSRYLRSKAAGEAEIAKARSHGIATTVLRPSVLFGRGDGFLSLFAGLARVFPVLPLGCAGTRFQPLHVEDAARVAADCLDLPASIDRSYDLCGPKVYTLKELVAYVGRITGHPRPILPLPAAAAFLQAAILEHLPGRVMTRDNVRSMQVDNVCGCPFPAEFGFPPTPLEAVGPLYLAERHSRMRYHRFRRGARRDR